MKVSRIARLSRYVRQNAIAFMALFVALGGTGAYAANTIGSADVIDESLLSADIKNGEVKAADIGLDQILGSRLIDGTVKTADIANNGVTSTDLVDNGTLSKDIADGAVTSADIQDDTITEDDAVRQDFLPFGSSDTGQTTVDPGVSKDLTIPCPFAEDVAVGGGHTVLDSDGNINSGGYVYDSGPVDTDEDGVNDAWFLGIGNFNPPVAEGGKVIDVTGYVNCVELRPDEELPAGAAKGAKSRAGASEVRTKPATPSLANGK